VAVRRRQMPNDPSDSHSDNSPTDSILLFPPGTVLYGPSELAEVIIQFPHVNDAIVFIEIMRDFSAGKIDIEIIGR
jgi:hypothetical protein